MCVCASVLDCGCLNAASVSVRLVYEESTAPACISARLHGTARNWISVLSSPPRVRTPHSSPHVVVALPNSASPACCALYYVACSGGASESTCRRHNSFAMRSSLLLSSRTHSHSFRSVRSLLTRSTRSRSPYAVLLQTQIVTVNCTNCISRALIQSTTHE